MAPPAEATAEAMRAALKALELDDSLAEAHAALGTPSRVRAISPRPSARSSGRSS